MAKLISIAAVGKNMELGKNNEMIWHLKKDLKFFKEKTMNHEVVMGYNTYESLPGVLPGRKYIILTHRDIDIPNSLVLHSFSEVMDYLKGKNDEVFIIGGAQIYSLFQDYVDEMYLTEIDASDDEATAFYPTFDKGRFKKEVLDTISDEEVKYKFTKYTRI